MDSGVKRKFDDLNDPATSSNSSASSSSDEEATDLRTLNTITNIVSNLNGTEHESETFERDELNQQNDLSSNSGDEVTGDEMENSDDEEEEEEEDRIDEEMDASGNVPSQNNELPEEQELARKNPTVFFKGNRQSSKSLARRAKSVKHKRAKKVKRSNHGPFPNHIENMVENLDRLNKNFIVHHNLLAQHFTDRIDKMSHLDGELFWPQLIGAMVTKISDQPVNTGSWIAFDLVNRISQAVRESESSNESDVESETEQATSRNPLQPPTPQQLVVMLMPFFLTIYKLNENNFTSVDDDQLDARYRSVAKSRNKPVKKQFFHITYHHTDEKTYTIAAISQRKLERVKRNLCLVIFILAGLLDSDDLKPFMSEQANAVLDYLHHVVEQGLGLTHASFVNPVMAALKSIDTEILESSGGKPRKNKRQKIFKEGIESIQAVSFALQTYQQCFLEFPADSPFSESLCQFNTNYRRFLEICEFNWHSLFHQGEIPKTLSLSKFNLATIELQILVNRTAVQLQSTSPLTSNFITSKSDFNSYEYNYWVFGNNPLCQQTYQLKTIGQQLKPNCRYYYEVIPLTTGPIRFGFARPIDTDDDSAEQNLTELPDSICLDPYEHGLWIYGQEFSLLKKLAKSKEIEGKVYGVLLETKEQNSELNAITFYENGKELNSKYDVDLNKIIRLSAVKAWSEEGLKQGRYLLSVAPAYGQSAVVILNPNYMRYFGDKNALALDAITNNVHQPSTSGSSSSYMHHASSSYLTSQTGISDTTNASTNIAHIGPVATNSQM